MGIGHRVHPDPRVSAYFLADKRNVHGLTDAAKFAKLVTEYEGLGLDGFDLAMAVLRAQKLNPLNGVRGIQFEAALAYALRHAGRETEVFVSLADQTEMYLPSPKKALPPGLSALQALTYLRVPEGTLRSADHLDELAQIPQPFRLSLWVKDVKLTLWDAARNNIVGIDFRGAYSNLTDIAALAGWSRLTAVDLAHTGITDLAPLRSHPLEHLTVSDTRVADLSPLAAMRTLQTLRLSRLLRADLTPVWGLTEVEDLVLSFTAVHDLAPLRAFHKLRRLDLWGTRFDSFEPLTGLPLEQLTANYSVVPDLSPLARIATLRQVSLYGVPTDTPGYDVLRRERPDVFISC